MRSRFEVIAMPLPWAARHPPVRGSASLAWPGKAILDTRPAPAIAELSLSRQFELANRYQHRHVAGSKKMAT
jgi:hypothetical protein